MDEDAEEEVSNGAEEERTVGNSREGIFSRKFFNASFVEAKIRFVIFRMSSTEGKEAVEEDEEEIEVGGVGGRGSTTGRLLEAWVELTWPMMIFLSMRGWTDRETGFCASEFLKRL